MSAIASLLDPLGACDPDLRIGIVDGTPDLDLPDLADSAVSIEPTMRLATAAAPDAHGTEICSLLFGRQAGIASGATGLVLPVFFGEPGGQRTGQLPRATQMDIARALYMAVERGMDIVNVSAGQRASTPEAGRHLEDALDLCHRRGVLVVAAAGNDGCDCLHVPAAVSTALAVGAMDTDGRPLATSNYGASYGGNGILAPGAEIAVTTLEGRRTVRTGTSYATALVTGVAARLLSAARRSGLRLVAADLRALLIETAAPCNVASDGDCARILAGRLDVAAAIERLHELGRSGTTIARTRIVSPPQPEGRRPMSSDVITQSIAEPAPSIPPAAIGTDSPAVSQSACGCGGGKSGCTCGGSGTCTCGGGDDAHDKPPSLAAQSSPVAAPDRAVFASAQEESPGVTQQACSPGKEPQKVYSIGSLWFDFGNEPRYDAIVQEMGDPVAANTPQALLSFLSDNLSFATGITFVLMQDQIPIYAITPVGAFAKDVYGEMIEAMRSSMETTGDLQRVAVPGFIHGSTQLMNGMILPVLFPDLRGMTKWSPVDLARAARAAVGDDAIEDEAIFNFLVRIYDELRNLGISPEDRAINFAATNAYQAATAFSDGIRRQLELYRLAVKKSPICRPDSDCWDVQLVMFDPENERRAGRFYRFTVDVSEVLPVTVGPMRSWSAPLGSI